MPAACTSVVISTSWDFQVRCNLWCGRDACAGTILTYVSSPVLDTRMSGRPVERIIFCSYPTNHISSTFLFVFCPYFSSPVLDIRKSGQPVKLSGLDNIRNSENQEMFHLSRSYFVHCSGFDVSSPVSDTRTSGWPVEDTLSLPAGTLYVW